MRQQITLKADAFGAPLRRVAVSYGRRPKGGANPYPASVPDRLWASSYDDEQLPLRLVEDIATVFNLTTRDDWRLALPYEQRQNVLTYAAGYDGYPASATGLSCEALDTPGGLLDSTRPRAFAGQTVTFYFDAAGSAALPVGAQPPRLALVHHVETAELDDQALAAYADIPLSELGEDLVRAGYLEGGKVLCEPGETATALWTVQSGYATYVDQGQWLPFQRPRSMRSTAIVAPRRFTYDAHSCVVESVTDGVGNRVRAQYDYRFLSPWRVIDPNENTQEALFDALGRVVATSSYGTERDDDGKLALTGFDPVSDFNPKADALASIDAALADPARAIQRAAAVYLYDTHSWMASRSPVQSAAFEADQHPDAVDPKPQIQIAMSHSDGFGRALQSKKKCPPGWPVSSRLRESSNSTAAASRSSVTRETRRAGRCRAVSSMTTRGR